MLIINTVYAIEDYEFSMRNHGFTSGLNFCIIVIGRSSYGRGRAVLKGCA